MPTLQLARPPAHLRERLALLALRLAVLHGGAPQRRVQLSRVDGGAARLVLAKGVGGVGARGGGRWMGDWGGGVRGGRVGQRV